VVADDWGNLNRLPHIEQALAASKVFWRVLGIDLRLSIQGLHANIDPTQSVWGPLTQHLHWTLGGQVPTVFVFSDAPRIQNGNLGQAFGNGIAVVAGNVLQPGGAETWLDELIDHELGHLLGLGHEEGTFMAPVLELHNRIVTQAQRTTLRREAKEF
jgi:hypothetical protein